MAVLLTDEGATAIATDIFRSGNNYTMKLYVNNYTPVDTATSASFTEASSGGYASKMVSGGSWTISTVANIVQAAYASQSWTFSGALSGTATIYGYWLEQSGKAHFADMLSTPFQPDAASGGTLNITPVIQLSKGTPA